MEPGRHSYTRVLPPSVTNKHLTLNGSFINQQSITPLPPLSWVPRRAPITDHQTALLTSPPINIKGFYPTLCVICVMRARLSLDGREQWLARRLFRTETNGTNYSQYCHSQCDSDQDLCGHLPSLPSPLPSQCGERGDTSPASQWSVSFCFVVHFPINFCLPLPGPLQCQCSQCSV